jgi:putative NIF3 family GTP cyclohydrolase 1 type 2
MEPVRSISSDRFVSKTILDAVRRGVDVLSLHTNLDAAPGGLNDELAIRLGLQDVTVPYPARCARIGRLSAPVLVSDLGRRVAREFGIPLVRMAARDDREVSRVFCASGSGMGYLGEALSQGADVIVTGDVRYHAAREALDMGIPVIDAGHYGLEKLAVGLMARAFRSELERRGIRVECIECDIEKEPFEAVP